MALKINKNKHKARGKRVSAEKEKTKESQNQPLHLLTSYTSASELDWYKATDT
jgi:hypothetical protein